MKLKQPATTSNNAQYHSTLRAHQIIEALEGREDLMVAMRGLDSEKIKPIVQQFSTMLNKSQKFLLTENIPFPKRDEKFELMPEAANLPADICYFERTQLNAGTWGALCFDISEHWPGGEFVPKWTCVLFLKNQGAVKWVMSPVVSNVYLNDQNQIKLTAVDIFQPEGIKKNADDLEVEKSFSNLTRAAASEIMFFLQMLACSNVKMQIVDKPHALNKKRIAKKQSPIDSYHVIHLPFNEKPKYQQNYEVGEKRTAPRFHFRRGHVRRIPTNGLPEHLSIDNRARF